MDTPIPKTSESQIRSIETIVIQIPCELRPSSAAGGSVRSQREASNCASSTNESLANSVTEPLLAPAAVPTVIIKEPSKASERKPLLAAADKAFTNDSKESQTIGSMSSIPTAKGDDSANPKKHKKCLSEVPLFGTTENALTSHNNNSRQSLAMKTLNPTSSVPTLYDCSQSVPVPAGPPAPVPNEREMVNFSSEVLTYPRDDGKMDVAIHTNRSQDYQGVEIDIETENYDEISCTQALLQGQFSQINDRAQVFIRQVWQRGWTVVNHAHLPQWLQDNTFLLQWHRPELKSFKACFNSIFRIHSETGNIWTHLLGCVAFLAITLFFLTVPSVKIQWQEKLVFGIFFVGAIICLGLSFLFHTVFCHSEKVGKIFNKLDYCGIAFLTMGSFVPWLHYSFFCYTIIKICYLVTVSILGTLCIVVSMFDKFAQPAYRPLRALVFILLGLFGVMPAFHYVFLEGLYNAFHYTSLGWLILMAVLYIVGAVIYALQVPERFFPGRMDVGCQSHQIFHIFVVIAAFVHYHGISQVAQHRMLEGDCMLKLI